MDFKYVFVIGVIFISVIMVIVEFVSVVFCLYEVLFFLVEFKKFLEEKIIVLVINNFEI